MIKKENGMRQLIGRIVNIVGCIAMAWGAAALAGAQERKNFFIPRELNMELKVKAAYNDERVFFRFEWPAASENVYHDYIHFQGGKWVTTAGSSPGIHPQRLYEDRVSFLLDDGSVRYFDTAGGYVTVHEEMRFLSNQAPAEEVRKHPYLGGKLKQADVRKYVPETRADEDWRSVHSEEELAALRKAGVFLDLWMWRSHRGNPIGYADDMWVLDYRHADQGRSAFPDNWDTEKRQPRFMYDPEKVGFVALRWEDVRNQKLTQKDIYYISEELAKPFDPSHAWNEGDTIPRRLLRVPDGSRADILGKGVWREGKWQVEMIRLLDTGNRDDKALRDRRRYTIAFAVHKDYTGSRWHHASLPMSFAMGVEGELVARNFSGSEPPWENIPWTTVALFYPGQVTWNWLVSSKHAGAADLLQGQSCATCHTAQLLGTYAVQHELRHDLNPNWYWTVASGMTFAAGLSLAGILAARRI
jgi:hypothetical protein